MRSQHQQLRLQNGSRSKRQVHSHLVTIKVSVKGCTCEWVKLQRFALDELRLESLNAQTVKRRSTVEQHRVSFHDILENVPHHGLLRIHNLLGALHCLHNTTFNHLTDDEWLVELGCHVLWHSALVKLQVRSNDDDRTRRVVYTLAQKVLTETSLLSFQAVAQRLQWTVAFRFHCAALAAVVKQAVDRLLKHALFISQNHFRCLDLDQALQAVVSDDHAAVQIIQI